MFAPAFVASSDRKKPVASSNWPIIGKGVGGGVCSSDTKGFSFGGVFANFVLSPEQKS